MIIQAPELLMHRLWITHAFVMRPNLPGPWSCGAQVSLKEWFTNNFGDALQKLARALVHLPLSLGPASQQVC